MGNVIVLQQKNSPQPEEDVVELLDGSLAEAMDGQITGVFLMVSRREGKNQIRFCGDFAEDPDFMLRSANDAFNALRGYTGTASRRPLPRGLGGKGTY